MSGKNCDTLVLYSGLRMIKFGVQIQDEKMMNEMIKVVQVGIYLYHLLV